MLDASKTRPQGAQNRCKLLLRVTAVHANSYALQTGGLAVVLHSSCTGLEQEWSTAEGDEFKSKLRGRSLLIIKLHINRWYLCKSGR